MILLPGISHCRWLCHQHPNREDSQHGPSTSSKRNDVKKSTRRLTCKNEETT